MSDKDKLQNEEELQKAIKDMLKGASPSIIDPNKGIGDPLDMVSKLGAHLEQGMMELYQNIMHLGETLDVARLHNFMLSKILVEKGIVTEEEIESKFKVEVLDEMRKQREQMQKNMEKDIQKEVTEKKE